MTASEYEWGDPTAPFPYCLTYEDYRAQMLEVTTRGLNQEQLDGFACISCGAALGNDRVKVGEKTLHWHTEDEAGRTSLHELYVGPCCANFVTCPKWCDRSHEPFVTAHKWLESAMHIKPIASFDDAIGTGDRVATVVVIMTEDSDGYQDAYVNISQTDLEFDASTCRRMAAALLDAAEVLDEINSTDQP